MRVDHMVDQFRLTFPLWNDSPEKRKRHRGSRDTHGTGNVSNRISRGK
jgi:hypothetical protein